MNPQLVEYIRAALASGQPVDSVKAALIQNGWKTEDIAQGFAQLLSPPPAYSAPVPMTTSSAPAHSKLPMILGAVAIVAVLAVASGFMLVNKKAANTEIAEPASTESTSYATSSSPNAEAVATTTTQTSIPVKVTASPVKSEIDAYGVDLYTLKQGVTAVERTTPTKMTIVYTRTGDEIERKISKTSNGGSETTTTTITLNSKEKLPLIIKEIETKIETDCQNNTTKECADARKVLDFLDTKCTILTKDEEVSACIMMAILGALNWQ